MKKRFFAFALALVIVAAAMPVFTYASSTEDTLTMETLDWSGLTDNRINTISATTEGAMPCVGNPRILVFYTTFLGGAESWDLDAEEAEEFFFGETGESLRTYYETSSYGKIHIEGDLYEYTTQKHTSEYTDASQVLDEIIEYYRDEINWADYDYNGDGYIDGVYLVARTNHSWGGANYVGGYYNSVGGMEICQSCFLISQDLGTVCHETCHMFGPPDMYAGVGLNPSGTKTDTIMDQNGYGGDLPGITKFVLGWIEAPVFVSGTGTAEITLDSYSTNGEILIIYPNGDPTNPNWMIVEYLTEEGNNHYNGVRIWKSNMALGDSYNAVTPEGWDAGSINSPYEFLEAMAPKGQTNYYYGPGESVTPYTNPSTSYGVSYKWVGTSKCPEELGFSGISITVNDMDSTCATITVEIDNEAADIAADAEFFAGNTTSDFINDSTRALIATVKAEQAMELTGDIFLKDPATGAKIPVEASLNAEADILYLYISAQDAAKASKDTAYLLNLAQTVTTYYGGRLNLRGFDGTVTLGDLPMPLQVAGPYSNGRLVYNDLLEEPNYYRVDDTHASYLSLEDGVLWLRTIDVVSRQTSAVELEVPVALSDPWLRNTLLLDDQYYVALFSDGYWGGTITYMAMYDREGRWVDGYTPTGSARYVGDNGDPMFRDENDVISELTVSGGKLSLKVTGISNDRAFQDSVHTVCDGYYAVMTNAWDPYLMTILTVYDAAGNTVLTEEYRDYIPFDVAYRDGKIYVMTVETDLKLYVYDSGFNLLEEKVLLAEHGMRYAGDVRMTFVGEQLWVEVDGVPATNTIDYDATFLFRFEEDACTGYYRHGNSSFRYCANAVHLYDDVFLLGEKNNYYLLSAGTLLSVTYGDVNADGAVNGRDVILLRQYIAGWNVEVDLSAADANADGRVNGLDMILLRQYIAGWNVTLGS